MIDKFKRYAYLEKSDSELESEKIINNLCLNLWNESGYATAYYLGAINQLKFLAKALRKSGSITRKDILMCIGAYRNDENVPDEIKKLVDMILKEFDYKENNNDT